MTHRTGRTGTVAESRGPPEAAVLYRIPAVSAHSLLPICTRREQQRAKAKTSSSPVNMEVALTTSVDKP